MPTVSRSASGDRRDGYGRVVHCNDPGSSDALALGYCGNAVSTTKYTVANFVPKSLFEQFRRVANLFFLVVACISFSPLAPYRAVSVLLPLVVVVGATMAKEALEDWRRKQQDIEVNNRKVKVYDGNHAFHETEWKKLRVGDIVEVAKDEFFPADLLLLSSSNDGDVCYVETMNLDGETNLKRKQCLKTSCDFHTANSFKTFKALIKCEDPNEKLYSFIGTLYHEGMQYPLSPQMILLRDSKLRNTQHIYGVVIFTGHDTKVVQNATDPPSKRSAVEKRMDKIIYVLFISLVLLSSSGSVVFGIKTKRDISDGKANRWYLRPDDSSIFFDPRRASFAAAFHFLTGLMLYGCLIPISLYISIEIVKILQSTFINQDQEMYSEEFDQPARARTSNLNEELGQVNTILSDKTGTLTCNSMEFVKCSIAGVDYGSEYTEVEKAVVRGADDGIWEFNNAPATLKGHLDVAARKLVKGFNFTDDRLMQGKWVKEHHPDVMQIFFRVLAICHTAIPVLNNKSDEVSYEAESPDESAFVVAAREIGFEFYRKTHASISLHEFDPSIGRKVDRTYQLLNVLEFSSSRKRMSVIVRTEENQLMIFCKGADSVIFGKLDKEVQLQPFESATKSHISKYSESGLRTMAIAYRILSEEEYRIWNDEFSMARNSVGADHDTLVEVASEKIERDLILIGATAVEDRLQKGVPECIDKLQQAGIKIWVLTGDKLETAVNIGFACHLLKKGMKQIIITLDALDIEASKKKDKKYVEKASQEWITSQLCAAQFQVRSSNGSSTPYALIIDGNALAFALSSSLEKPFLDLAVYCASVICCRTSPKQKALVTRLVKRKTRRTTLAIGDGANDVGMLQEADIGIGISGAEGMQAVMSSDFAIAQFRFLERLLLVHGHWCYRRISAMICYFFYKNITFGFTLFCFEAHTSFSALPAYNDWFISFYNIAFTSFPVIALGVFDKDLSSRLCLKMEEVKR
ncbi:probable phospholipid-transporting ATPase 8 isoform X2 [Asparagus officinalis]|uniref:probable phospholipid-transporting ATPase 8 isoform X2 n=1 Tax=Asparagus officinalis TaxID=4686 RepID=UPI00098E549B|nr:probable phospholipid-transporting ATPase 8 isoform X2 [Asparagus officinalis]